MFSFFRRKSTAAKEPTFKARVEDFWKWYSEVGPRLYRTIEEKKTETLATEMSEAVDKVFDGFAWVFGPGANGKGHSFTISGEGVSHKQFLTEYWLQRAPSIPGWTFYSSRQASTDLKGWCLNIKGNRFDPLEFWLTPHLDEEEEKIDMSVWHPLFGTLSEGERWTVLFLVLDEVLGEIGTQMWMGQINMSDSQLAESMPIRELPQFIRGIESQRGWKKTPPTETWTGYQMKEPHARFRRGDVIAGTSNNMHLIHEFLESKDEMNDPLKGSGADFAFVQFDAAILPTGGQVDARGKIEDALADALGRSHSGKHIGGAMGTKYAYIDLLIFDGAESLRIIQDVLREQNLPKGTSIEYFSHEKRGHRIVI